MDRDSAYRLVASAPKFETNSDVDHDYFDHVIMRDDRHSASKDEIEVELSSWSVDVSHTGADPKSKRAANLQAKNGPTLSSGETSFRPQLGTQNSDDTKSECLLDQNELAISNAEEEFQWELDNADSYHSSTSSCLRGRKLVYLSAACSSMCSVLLGYDVGVMSGAKEFIQPDLNLSDNQTAVIVGSLNLVAAAGALIAGRAADSLGRRYTIALACSVFILGAFVMSVSPSFMPLLLGRIVTGIGVGSAMMVAPIYIAELAPPDIRGALVSLTDVSINFGILLGYGGSILFDEVLTGDGAKWRAMVGAGAIPPALVLICLILMPESPRWLIAQGDSKGGYAVLLRILNDSKLARASLNEMSCSIAQHSSEASWKDVLCPRDRAVGAAVSIGLGLGFWQQASGSEAAVYYSPEVLKNSGWDGRSLLLGNVAVGLFKLSGEVVAFFLLDKLGRRPLLIVSAITSTLCLLGIAFSFFQGWGGSATLALLCAFMLCFSLGLGPVTFVVASEIFPLTVRGKAMSLVVFTNRAMSGAIALSYTAIARAFTPSGSFLAFSFISAVSVWFYYSKVPETKGKTLEQITAQLELASAIQSSSNPRIRNISNPDISIQRNGNVYV